MYPDIRAAHPIVFNCLSLHESVHRRVAFLVPFRLPVTSLIVRFASTISPASSYCFFNRPQCTAKNAFISDEVNCKIHALDIIRITLSSSFYRNKEEMLSKASIHSLETEFMPSS